MAGDAFDPQLIDLIYKTVFEPALWSQVLDQFADHFQSEHALLFTYRNIERPLPFVSTAGLSENDRARFFSPRGIELRGPLQDRLPSGRAGSLAELCSLREFEDTDFYNEIVRPTGTIHAGFIQQDTAGLSFNLNICRHRSGGEFTPAETRSLQSLMGHLTSVLELQHRVRTVERRSDALLGALDLLDEGTIIADNSGKPLIVNKRAQSILDEKDGLFLGVGGLRTGAGVEADALLNAISTVSRSATGESATLRLPRKLPRQELLVEVLPVWRMDRTVPGSPDPSVVIFIREPDAPVSIDTRAISEIYRLTRREAEIGGLLAVGLNIQAIAAKLSLAEGTVRFNLKRCFEKTGAHSQAALVALLRGFALRRNS